MKKIRERRQSPLKMMLIKKKIIEHLKFDQARLAAYPFRLNILVLKS